MGWLPDCVYTGDKFEWGLAFFADPLGRISRFSREPADLAMARRLDGQAALPGLVNGHSQALHRLLRGRPAPRARAASVLDRLAEADVYDTARMAFLEMLLTGITCVGEFHTLHHPPEGTPGPDPNVFSYSILRAARDTGIRLALHKVACARARPEEGLARSLIPTPDQFIREMEALREHVERNFPGDGVWLGVAAHSLCTVPPDYLKAVSEYAHAQRMRLQVPFGAQPADNEACVAEHGRRPVALLAERGLLDKRFTAVHAQHLTDDEIRLLGTARATVCACPTSERARGDGVAPVDRLLAAGVAVSLGTDCQVQIDLFEDARLLEYPLRVGRPQRQGLGSDPTVKLLQAATSAGARSVGASSGALEVGRPADFFTVNLYDPSIAGAEPDALAGNIVFSLERRAVRDVWIGGQPRVTGGRHPLHGPIVNRFVTLRQRLAASV